VRLGGFIYSFLSIITGQIYAFKKTLCHMQDQWVLGVFAWAVGTALPHWATVETVQSEAPPSVMSPQLSGKNMEVG